MVANDPPTPSRIIAGRYRLGSRLGSGLEAAVFEAFDEQLQRTVVLKLVHPDLGDIPQVRDVFGSTMRVASSLHHPNVAAVLDFGAASWNDREVLYVASEYLGGGSLRDLLDRGRLLSPSQLVLVGLDACKALDVMHRHDLLHTDVRPSTLVFGDDRRLRLVDAGLAQVLHDAADDVTGRSIDRAKYASPEEALGNPLQAKSDIYSLCLSLMEAVTGVVPFVGDSSVSTLANRVDKLMPVSADLGQLAAVFERAGRPQAADRYSAAEFGRALVQAAEKLPRPAPLPIITNSLFAPDRGTPGEPVDPTGPLVRADLPASAQPADAPAGDAKPPSDDRPTEMIAVVEPAVAVEPVGEPVDDQAAEEQATEEQATEESTADESTAVESTAEESTADDEPVGLPVIVEQTGAAVVDPTPAPGAPLPPPPPSPAPPPPPTTVAMPVQQAPTQALPVNAAATPGSADDADEEYDPADEFPEHPAPTSGGRRWFLAVLAVMAVGGGVLAWYNAQPETALVPNLAGLSYGEALNQLGPFEAVFEEEASETVEVGAVIRTDPAADTELEHGKSVTIFVSTGPAPRPLPELVGLTVAEATTALSDIGLVLIEGTPVYDEVAPPGEVLSWTVPAAPTLTAGGTVVKGTTVQVIASLGPAPRTVPDLRNKTLADATVELDTLVLVIAQGADEFSNEVPAGQIIRQEPAPGSTVERGATITVVVSKGQDLVALPNLSGMTFEQITAALGAAGFGVNSVTGNGTLPLLAVNVNGAPTTPGQLFLRGTNVDLVFQSDPPPTTVAP